MNEGNHQSPSPAHQRSGRGDRSRRNAIVQVDAATSSRACYLVGQHALSSSLFLADALIGLTAVERGQTLLTANAMHYQVIKGLSVEVFKA
jgi:predicted nucleic acid-binding protein